MENLERFELNSVVIPELLYRIGESNRFKGAVYIIFVIIFILLLTKSSILVLLSKLALGSLLLISGFNNIKKCIGC